MSTACQMGIYILLNRWNTVGIEPKHKQCSWQLGIHSPSVQFSSVAQLCPALCDPMNRSTPGLPVHHQLPEFRLTSIELVMPFSHLILCCPLLLLPPIPPSIRVFSNESTLHVIFGVRMILVLPIFSLQYSKCLFQCLAQSRLIN